MGNKKSTEFPPRWCEYCHYFGEFRGWYVCYRSWLARIGFLLPETVPFSGCCEHFKLAKRYTMKQKTR